MDKAAREKAEKSKSSLNSVLVDALEKGLAVHENPPLYNDMDDLAGSWVHDTETEAVLEELWK